ncbi:hypothetical protein NP233_g6160 [Leucocoprinus birnbaumii]|uniref:DUF6534 domain-containing protein n=1 Tax=Leucocoprinus birnbaumii TaxID=56174 RepID=A0AAD5VSR6_9AGAR|nr:hypothetical protein NP233_g6160 [Leucocoprinus birnbaumii]
MAPNSGCVFMDGQPEVGQTFLFGIVLDMLLFGILTTQIYVYYLGFPKDRLLVKCAVGWVYVIGISQTIVAMRDLYRLATSARCPGALFRPEVIVQGWWTLNACSTAVAWTAQCYYAYRIYVISKNLWIAGIITLLSLAQFGSGIVGAYCFGEENLRADSPVSVFTTSPCVKGFDRLWGPLNVACDVTITLYMTVFLLKERRKTVKKRTHMHVGKLVQLIIETGMATSATVIAYTLLFNMVLNFQVMIGLWYALPGIAMGKVYSNSMMALLNNRMVIEGGRDSKSSAQATGLRSEFLEDEVPRANHASQETVNSELHRFGTPYSVVILIIKSTYSIHPMMIDGKGNH